MVIANDNYQYIEIVCLSVSNQGAFIMSCLSGRSALILAHRVAISVNLVIVVMIMITVVPQ